jgi:hypothetical protein
MDLDTRYWRRKDASRAGARDGGASRIVGGKQRTADSCTQGRNGCDIVGPEADQHVDVRRRDANVERQRVELRDRRALRAASLGAKGDLPQSSAVVDQAEWLHTLERVDRQRASYGPHGHGFEIELQAWLIGVVLEFGDGAVGSDAPAGERIDQVAPHEFRRIILKQVAAQGRAAHRRSLCFTPIRR